MFVHGEAQAAAVARVSAALFGEVPFADLSEDEFAIVKENAPKVSVADGLSVVDVLVESGLATSKREARTFIEGGAVQVNGVKVVSLDALLSKEQHGNLVLLKRGKKHVSLVEVC